MQKKLRLLKADRYAFFVCAQMMSNMIVAYLEGRQAAKWLGCEQGAVPDWDDIVQELSDGSLHHTQVKRQLTDFSNEKAKRSLKASRRKKASPAISASTQPKLPDLSAFDESITALGKWFSPATVSDGKVRTFTIHVPDRQVKVKQEFDMRNFEEFCVRCNLRTVTPDGLKMHAKNDPTAAHIFDWLTTWCGFTDWAHIHNALRNLKVEIKSLEHDIKQSAETLLHRYFDPASDALGVLLQDLEDNVTDAGAATPRQMFALIRRYLRPGLAVWTQYAMEDTTSNWEISGCVSDHAHYIEVPHHTVPIIWNDSSQIERRLKICVKYKDQTWSRNQLVQRLMRLALHLRGLGYASLAEYGPWSVAIKSALGNTLGVAQNDFSSIQWIEDKNIYHCIDPRQLASITEANDECASLDSAMGMFVWNLTKTHVSSAIYSMPIGDLQAGVDGLWRTLYPLLDADQVKMNSFLVGMLSPASEKLDALGMMRVGPKTVDLLTSGFMMLMITAVALRRHADVMSLLSGNDIRVIALRYWGGPASSSQSARALVDEDDDTEVEDFLGKEVANIVLVSAAHSTYSEINRLSIASDRSSQDSFGTPRRAMLAVTNSRSFQQAVRSGEIEMVAKLLEPELRLRGLAREENIIKTELTKE